MIFARWLLPLIKWAKPWTIPVTVRYCSIPHSPLYTNTAGAAIGRNTYDGRWVYLRQYNILKEGQGYVALTPHRATYKVGSNNTLMVDWNGYISIDFIPFKSTGDSQSGYQSGDYANKSTFILTVSQVGEFLRLNVRDKSTDPCIMDYLEPASREDNSERMRVLKIEKSSL